MKRILSLILVLVLVLGSMPLAFADEHEMTAGEYLKANGLLEGDDSGDLMEEKTMTRAEMIKIFLTLLGLEEEAAVFPSQSTTFEDVAPTDWFAPYVGYAEVFGYTNGVGDNKFAPSRTVTKREVATFLLRGLGYNNAWEIAVDKAPELGIDVDAENEVMMTRGDAFDMMKDTLSANIVNTNVKLGTKLNISGFDGEDEVVAEDVTMDTAVALNENVVEVALDEDMDAPEMVDASIFMVMDADDAALTVESAEFAPWATDNYTVLVTLEEELEAGEAYTMTSGDSEVDFGGMVADEDEPTISDVTSEDYNKVKVTFNEAVMIDDLTVEIAEKYGDKDELAVLDFEYDGSDAVIVTTGEQSDATLYEVTVNGAVDLAGNEMEEDDSETFTGQEMDTDEQEVTGASAKDSLTVKVTFRTKVEMDEAVDASNYTVTEKYGDKDEVVVESVEMDSDDDDTDVDESMTVAVLTLADHTEEATLYEVEVDNVGTLYGEAMGDTNSETFTGKGEDTDAPDGISVTSTSNTEIVVTVTDDSDIEEDVDVDLFSVVEKYGDKDELAVIAVTDVDTEARKITISTEEQDEATLYEVTMAEGLSDKFGNVTDEDLDATFTGSGIADEIDTVTATNTADKKVLVKFNENYGAGALRVINYKIDGDIGYPTKVEAVDHTDFGSVSSDTEDMHVLLTVSELDKGDIYELTVKNVKNSDGVAMDEDGVTDKFAAQYGAGDAKVVLEAVVSTDDQTIKLYFDTAVEDITGISEGALAGNEFDYNFEGDSPDVDYGLSGYGYIDPNNEKVFVVVEDSADAFNNPDGDEITLVVNSSVVTDIDTEDDANEVVFAENTSTPDDILVDGVVALSDQVLKVYFNQPVRYVNSASFADVKGDFNNDGNEQTIGFSSVYENNDEKTEWIFVLNTPMTDKTDSKLDFVVAGKTSASVSTHLVNDSKVPYSDESGDDTVEFSKNTDSKNYIDDIGVTMLDAQTIKIYYPELMNTSDVVDISNYDIELDTDANDEETYESTITRAVWDKDDNSVELTLNAKIAETVNDDDVTKLNLAIATTVANKSGTKTVQDDDGDRFFTEFAISTSSADEIAISDVTAKTTTSGAIVIELDQPITGAPMTLTATQFLTDFKVIVEGTALKTSDINGTISVANDDATTEDDVSTGDNDDATTLTINLNTALSTNDAVEVEINDTDNGLTGLYKGLGLDTDAESVTSVK